MEDNGLNEYTYRNFLKPTATNAKKLTKWKKNVAKARRILLEGVRYHIVLNLHGKETPYETWNALTDLFQKNNDHKKLALKDKLQKIKIEKDDTIP